MSPQLGAAIADAVGAPPEGLLGARLMLQLLGHSIVLGAILAAVAFASGRLFEPTPEGAVVDPAAARAASLRGVLGASNLLFLCVGLTGTMILVNNNMVRAFAIAAAVALVRFRVKLDSKSTNASLLFAVLGGIACGLQELALAWVLVGVHVALTALLVSVVRALAPAASRVSQPALAVPSPLESRHDPLALP